MPNRGRSCCRPTLLGNPWTGPDAVQAYRRFITDVAMGVFGLGEIEKGLDVQLVFRKPIDRWQDVRHYIVPRQLLRGPLACYCPLDRDCHVDILVQYASRPKRHLLAFDEYATFIKAMRKSGHSVNDELLYDASVQVAAGTFDPKDVVATTLARLIDGAANSGALTA